jgi:hypothetical protein
MRLVRLQNQGDRSHRTEPLPRAGEPGIALHQPVGSSLAWLPGERKRSMVLFDPVWW